MKNAERIYYMFQDSECKHWFRDNADMLQLAEYLDKKGYFCLPHFTQDIDYHKVLKQIKVEVAKEIFEEIEKLTYRLLNDADYTMGDIVYDITELKNKYIGEK